MDSIRGILEIEQAERVGVASTSLREAALTAWFDSAHQPLSDLTIVDIASGVIVQHIDKINQPLTISPNDPPHPFYASLLLSIVATLLLIALGWCWINKAHKKQGTKN